MARDRDLFALIGGRYTFFYGFIQKVLFTQ